MKEQQKNTHVQYPIIKKKAKRLRGYLPVIIQGEAKVIDIEEVEPGERYATQQADDERVIIDMNYTDSLYLVGSLLLIGAFFFFIMALNKEELPVLALITGAIAALYFVYGLTMPKKEIILDRQSGLFTYPGFMWGKAITIPFKDAVVNIGSYGTPPSLSLNAYHPNGFTSTTLAGHHQIQTWNLFVWYMDRNRPLPPGTAFDPYRQKDYERRKKAGFPPPLYHSVIPTPEWKPGSGSSIVNNLN